MPFSEEQKKELVLILLESQLLGSQENKPKAHFDQINLRLSAIGLPLTVNMTGCLYNGMNTPSCNFDDEAMRQKLITTIFENVSGKEYYQLLKDSYDILDQKFPFNTSEHNRSRLCFSLLNGISAFHHHEINKSGKKALRDSLLFCLPIVTIFFVPWFHSWRRNSYAKEHFFQTMHVESAVKELQPKPKNNGISYGLINKHIQLNTNPNFKEVVFNKKGDIRKFVTSIDSGFGRSGINFLGTKEQITRSNKRFMDRLPKNSGDDYHRFSLK